MGIERVSDVTKNESLENLAIHHTKYNRHLLQRAFKTFKRIKWRFDNVTLKENIDLLFNKPQLFEIDLSKKYTFKEIKYPIQEIKECPFLLIKPTGIENLKRIKDILAKNNISISDEIDINDYRSLAKALYQDVNEMKLLAWFQINEKILPKSINNRAKLILLDGVTQTEVDLLKKKIRKKIGINFYTIKINENRRETGVTPVHASDLDKLKKEFNICMSYIANMQG